MAQVVTVKNSGLQGVVSTRAHMYAGVAAGIRALSGSLHGGANAEVMKMLISLEKERDLAGWVKSRLDSGDKIMGMGHAVYKTMDPRARFLRDMARRLGEKTGQPRWHDLSTLIERFGLEEFGKQGKPEIQPNMDFYSAPLVPHHAHTGGSHDARVRHLQSRGVVQPHHRREIRRGPGKTGPLQAAVRIRGAVCGLMGWEHEPVDKRR